MDRNTLLYQDGLQYSNDSNDNRYVKKVFTQLNWIKHCQMDHGSVNAIGTD